MRTEKHLCDRCEREIDGPYLTVTVNYHHPRTLDICRECETDFTLWLGKHPLWGTTLDELLQGSHHGAGNPSKERIEEYRAQTKAPYYCNCDKPGCKERRYSEAIEHETDGECS